VAAGFQAWTAVIVIGIILLVFALCFGGYFLWRRHKRKQASEAIVGGLGQDAAHAPRDIKSPESYKSLEDLRGRFLKGIEVYRSRGKDIYIMPWYLVIGQSACGKTEAIRRSNLDFLRLDDGGEDPFFKGAGGTINMDWWFTNQGIILDTAGKMVFPEAGEETGISPQFQEFLRLLKKHRGHCPINGLLLAISAENLVADRANSAQAVAKKAGKIARQLEMIQQTLDIRFPVWILVTKCDYLTGFKELFEGMEELEFQDQMLGWSNPDPRDAPFRPELVDQHLTQVAERLRKRRLALLRDPRPTRGPRSRRADEVDALYALPKSLDLITPRLRRYLETIFASSTFSSKPLFLRGIYFTSAIQTGVDMDEAVWAALGLATSEMPTSLSKTQDLGKPFFLRDLFLERVFRERGLVTRATNTRRMLRRRQLALIGASAACLLMVLAFGWLGNTTLKKDIAKQEKAWKAASENWNHFPGRSGSWNEIVNIRAFRWNYNYQDQVEKTNLIGFHQQLRDYATKDLTPSLLFRPASWFISTKAGKANRLQAQRQVLEGSVVLPLIEQTRYKMMTESAAGPYLSEALQALLRLEADLALGRPFAATNAADVATNHLLPYLCYLTETNSFPLLNDLAEVYRATYSRTNLSIQEWPPKRATGGSTLASNKALTNGLDLFFAYARAENAKMDTNRAVLENARDALVKFEEIESRWSQAAAGKKDLTPPEHLGPLADAKTNLDLLIQKSGRFTTTNDSLESLAKEMQKRSAESGTNAVQAVQRAMLGLPPSLLKEIQDKLNNFQKELAASTAIPGATNASLGALDTNSLRFHDFANGVRMYAFRFNLYTQAFAFRHAQWPDPATQVGKKWVCLTERTSTAEKMREIAKPYLSAYAPLPLTSGFGATLDHLLSFEESKRSNFVRDYAAHVVKQLQGFEQLAQANPVTSAWLAQCQGFMTNVADDLKLAVAAQFPDQLGSLSKSVKTTQTNLMAAFAGQRENELAKQVGFPVNPDPKADHLTGQQVVGLSAFMNQLQGELKAVATFPQEPLANLQNKVRNYAVILDFLVSNGVPRQISTTFNPDPQDPVAAKVILGYHGLSIVQNGPPFWRDIAKKGGANFGRFAIEQGWTITSTDLPPPQDGPGIAVPVKNYPFRDWALFSMMADANFSMKLGAERKSVDLWVVVGRAETDRIKLRVDLDAQLPPNDVWPLPVK
jgi:hypothetical protein